MNEVTINELIALRLYYRERLNGYGRVGCNSDDYILDKERIIKLTDLIDDIADQIIK